jgi:hypothetical protein
MQVTVKIRIEPKPRAHRPIVYGPRNSPAPKDEPQAPVFDRRFDQWVPGESAPCFQFKGNAFFITDNRDQIARVAAAQHTDQLRQQAGRKGLSPNIEIDVGSHRNACILQFREHVEITLSCLTYCAMIHLSDPVSLTATLVRKMWSGLPSAVPRCSVENSRGPAFL